MPHSPRIALRATPELYAACKAKADAAGLSVPLWVRQVLEQATGVHADVKRGFAYTGAAAEAGRAGGFAKAAAAKNPAKRKRAQKK